MHVFLSLQIGFGQGSSNLKCQTRIHEKIDLGKHTQTHVVGGDEWFFSINWLAQEVNLQIISNN